MTNIVERVGEWPLLWGWLALFGIVLVRAGGTYGLGRAVAAGVVRGREPSERTAWAMQRINRWGPWAVAASFLTVGVQTVVNLSAGLMRMTFGRYLRGLLPGAVIWATIWATAGLGAIVAIVSSEFTERLWGLVILVLVIIALGWWRRAWHTRR